VVYYHSFFELLPQLGFASLVGVGEEELELAIV